MFATRIWLKDLDKEMVRQICNKIAKKDETFFFEIKKGFLFIYSKDKDKAHKRGMIFIKKYLSKFDKNLGYDVIWLK